MKIIVNAVSDNARRVSVFEAFAAATVRSVKLVGRVIATLLLVCAPASCTRAQTHTFSLNSTNGIKFINVRAEPVTFKERRGLSVTDAVVEPSRDKEDTRLAILTVTDFQNGVIEVDLAGDVLPGAIEAARGFVGIAFRCAPDAAKFECIYLRPTNGRAEDQWRRNHAVQYISVPGFPWNQLREDSPGQYETYVDLVPGEWTKIKIEVRDGKARLFVHGVEQPTLLVNDLKQGNRKGSIALMIGPGTIAHFSNLRVTEF